MKTTWLDIELPWPPSELTPNGRCHWARKARFVKAARTDASYSTFVARCKAGAKLDPKTIKTVFISYMFCPPSRRKRDDDNLIAAMKPYRDGIAERLGVDDNCFRTVDTSFGNVHKGGRVLATLRIYHGDD